MDTKTKQYLALAIIQHLDGDIDQYLEHVAKAKEAYARYRHLYQPLSEMARVRRGTA